MALINKKTGEYLRVDNYLLQNNEAIVYIYENKQHRIDGDSKFKKSESKNVHLPDLAGALNTQKIDKTIAASIKTVCYEQLKKLPDYEGWESDE